MLLMRLRVHVMVLALGLVLPSMANAASLVFNPQPLVPGGAYPDIRSNATLLSYSTSGICPFLGATAGCLQISGININLTPSNPGVPVNFSQTANDLFTLYANINSAGTFLGGVLQIRGGALGAPYNVPDNTTIIGGAAAGNFGVLTQFGLASSAGGPDVFTFLANVTDPLGIGFGSLVGVQISTNNLPGLNPFSSNFNQANAAGIGIAAIDTFRQTQATVPEPGSFLLLATGGALLALRKRFRRRPLW